MTIENKAARPGMGAGASRLRKAGLTGLGVTGAVAAAVAIAAPAEAAIVYSGAISITDGGIDNTPVPVVIAGDPVFSIEQIPAGKGEPVHVLSNLSPDFQYAFDTNNHPLGGQEVTQYALGGAVVDGALPLSNQDPAYVGSPGSSDYTGAWDYANPDGYFAFQFNPTGTQVLNGWGHLVIAGGKGSETLTLTEYAYDDSGAPITVGEITPPPPVPTLGEWATLAFSVTLAGAAFVSLRRRRVDQTGSA